MDPRSLLRILMRSPQHAKATMKVEIARRCFCDYDQRRFVASSIERGKPHSTLEAAK